LFPEKGSEEEMGEEMVKAEAFELAAREVKV